MEQFHFKGFNPGPHIRVKANRLLSKLLEEAPSDAAISAVLAWDGKLFQCSIEIGSRIYPIAVTTNHRNAGIALDKAELTLSRKLAKHGAQSMPAGEPSIPFLSPTG
ncbi:MAG: hypothetical protein AB7K68_14280 [Bacteriovoracia bacterium]